MPCQSSPHQAERYRTVPFLARPKTLTRPSQTPSYPTDLTPAFQTAPIQAESDLASLVLAVYTKPYPNVPCLSDTKPSLVVTQPSIPHLVPPVRILTLPALYTPNHTLRTKPHHSPTRLALRPEPDRTNPDLTHPSQPDHDSPIHSPPDLTRSDAPRPDSTSLSCPSQTVRSPTNPSSPHLAWP